MYYTYAYLREDGTPYYIGKGKGNRAYRSDMRKGCGKPKDKSRILILKRFENEEDAFKHEIYMIAVLGRKDLGTGILRNLTNGGEGVSGSTWENSEEFSQKTSERFLGVPKTLEHRRKISKALKGKKQSAEHNLAISRGKKGKPWSQARRDAQKLRTKK